MILEGDAWPSTEDGRSAADTTSIVHDIEQEFPCRQVQIQQLASLLRPEWISPFVLVIHGLTATGKTTITGQVLNRLQVRHVVIKCRECVTGRHLLEKTLAACCNLVASLPGSKIDRSRFSRCESLSVLLAQLQRLLADLEGQFVLVFDGIDQQREAPSMLEAGLARFSEYIPNLSIVFIAAIASSLHFHGTPPRFIHFPSYTRREALLLVQRHPPHTLLEDGTINAEDNLDLWANFCSAVWDSQATFVARDIISFRSIAKKLWLPFIRPIQNGTLNARAFSKLMVANRSLFQSEDLLENKIVSQTNKALAGPQSSENLSYFSKYLLCAAYLASYNPPKTDEIYFTKYTEKRKRRRGGAGTGQGRPAKHRKIPRRLLAPSAFPLERLLAIFHAILPHDVKLTVDIYTQLATLTSLRLLTRSGMASDVLDPGTKWRVNAGWDYALRLGRGVGLELSEYAFEG